MVRHLIAYNYTNQLPFTILLIVYPLSKVFDQRSLVQPTKNPAN